MICDLAETYGIYDYRQLPVKLVAALSYGLRDDSRIKMGMNEQRVSFETLLLAGISDNVRLLLWMNSKDGEKNKNRPTPIVSTLIGETKKVQDTVVFNSGEDFERKRRELIGGDC